MRNVLQRLLGAGALVVGLCLGSGAEAASISLVPSSGTLSLGGSLDVDVVIDGLGDGVAPSLAAFDLDVAFDASVLTFVSIDFGLELGDPLFFQALTASSLLGGPVRVDLAETSLLSNAALDASQSPSFVLATLHFTALALGTSPLSITQAVLASTSGGSLAATLTGTSVDVVVPEPASLALVALGLGALAARRRAQDRAAAR